MGATKTESLQEAAAARPSAGESPEVGALVERAKCGDADAFGDLMRLYEHRIIALGIQMGLSRDDAQDACQDAFTKVFRYIARFRSGQSFYRWLYRIAVHAAYDHLRWSRPPGVSSIEETAGGGPGGLPDAVPSLHDRVESADLTRKLVAGIDDLSRRERIVFVLRDLQQLSTREIGRILRLSPVTVRRHCMSARRRLKERLFPAGD
jgi:RNA polymerase sigma-70 factor (ECF subfamily)